MQQNSETCSTDATAVVDIAAPGVAKLLARRISQDVDEYCIKTFDDGDRWHLGASLIGQECRRAAWYGYRWCGEMQYRGATDAEKRANHARMQRLFNRGHEEEHRFIRYLRGIGWTVYEYDESKPPNEKGEFPQFRIHGYKGHFGGSLDGIGIPPARYGLGNMPFLLEFKTNGTGAGFQKLLDKGMVIAKEQHFSQMSTYGSDPAYQIQWGLYQNVCKNDDNIHFEIVKLDWKHGERMRERAAEVIDSDIPPHRLSDNPTFFKCKMCDYFKQCHENAPVRKNCRSCKHAEAVEAGEWKCRLVENIIPRDFVPKGCDSWRSCNV